MKLKQPNFSVPRMNGLGESLCTLGIGDKRSSPVMLFYPPPPNNNTAHIVYRVLMVVRGLEGLVGWIRGFGILEVILTGLGRIFRGFDGF